MAIDVNPDSILPPTDKVSHEAEELMSFMLTTLKESQKRQTYMTIADLYNTAIHDWQNGSLKARPYLQLVHTWVDFATTNEWIIIKEFSGKSILVITSKGKRLAN